ncbi:acetyltransferase [Rhizobium sp. N122]|nr:acetyltransferase [Rhizobium sp. N122]
MAAVLSEIVIRRARGQEIDAGMIEFAIAEAKGRGIGRVALTLNAIRRDAPSFR